MKRIASFFTAITAAGLMAACVTTAGIQPSPAQIAEQVCPSVQVVIADLQLPAVLDPVAAAKLAIAQPIIARVCASAESATAPGLRSLQANTVPQLIEIVGNSGMAQAKKDAAIATITAVQAIIAPVVAQVAAASAPAATSLPAASASQ